eukprot:TRINITY_DN1541_c0_g1_i1.p1 TRINITY_DN1541_c0_g1~~TRINITY_DN1541_c0_g1_i1.p1  ORF type:complete len:514 (-),score=122.51 TRINITY_DN1541_c0_g1_i1:238-1779(-)
MMPTAEGIISAIASIPSLGHSASYNDNSFFLDTEQDRDSAASSLNQDYTNGDSDIFKYFLSDDLTSTNPNDTTIFMDTADIAPISSPISDSSDPTPPQLSPQSSVEDYSSSPIYDVRNSASYNEENHSLPTLQKVKEEDQPSRKRSAPSSSKDSPTKEVPVHLSREELMKLSGKGLETQQNVASGRPASVDEERQLKRQRRLIKNRESAQLSRLRKKVYIEELERKVNQITTENENMAKQLHSVNVDKKKLQDEVAYLTNIIKQSPALSQQLSARKPVSARNAKAAGICLLVVLFSFGLLFNSTPGLLTEDGNDLAPKGKNFYAGRVLKSLKDEDASVAIVPEKAIVEASSVLPVTKSVEVQDSALLRAESRPEGRQIANRRLEDAAISQKQDEISRKRKMKIADETESRLSLPDSQPKSDWGLVPIDDGLLRNTTRSSGQLSAQENTAYIYCSEAQQVRALRSSTPENIALLIPSSVLNATLDPAFDSSLLEVSCQVLNLHLWPMPNASTRF